MRTTTIFLTAALILASFIGISCRKEMSEPASETPVTVIGTIIDNSATKVSFTEDSNAIKTSWEVGDNIIGWDESGNKIELKIDNNDRIVSGKAIFTLVSGTLPTTDGSKIFMIYAPDKHASDLADDKSLTYDLSSQPADKVPALMTAIGTLTERQIILTFAARLAIVAVKNPKLDLPQSAIQNVTELKLSGSNVKSSVSISFNNSDLTLNTNGDNTVTKACNFYTDLDGNVSGTIVYFAVPPSDATAQVTVSTSAPAGYEIVKSDASLAAGYCYMLSDKDATRKVFTITIPTVDNGSFTTSPSGSAAWDETVTITASPTNPSTDYELTPNSITVTKAGGVTVTLSGFTFIMPQDNVTVTGAFQKMKYTLTSSVNDSDMGSVAMNYTTGGTAITSGDAIEWGSGVTVDPSANTYYEVEKITYGTTDITTAKTFNMPKADTEVSVIFRKCSYTITKADTSNGSFDVTPSSLSSQWDETVTVTATPNTNYIVDEMTYTDESGTALTITFDSSNIGTFTMPKANTTVDVTFKLNKFAITKDPVSITGASFTVTKSGTGVTEATIGDALKVEATCPNGYKVDKITVYKTGDTSTSVSVEDDGTFTMPEYAVSVKVEFKIDESGSGTELTPGGLI